jgi:hypothetical protein
LPTPSSFKEAVIPTTPQTPQKREKTSISQQTENKTLIPSLDIPKELSTKSMREIVNIPYPKAYNQCNHLFKLDPPKTRPYYEHILYAISSIEFEYKRNTSKSDEGIVYSQYRILNILDLNT